MAPPEKPLPSSPLSSSPPPSSSDSSCSPPNFSSPLVPRSESMSAFSKRKDSGTSSPPSSCLSSTPPASSSSLSSSPPATSSLSKSQSYSAEPEERKTEKGKDPKKEGGVIKSGFLTKQGGGFKSWKKRWCVLDEEGVSYYKGKDATEANFCGKIELVSGVEVGEHAEKTKTFEIRTAGRVYLLTAEKEEEVVAWVSAVSGVLSKK